MRADQNRIKRILEKNYTYYDREGLVYGIDNRLTTDVRHLLKSNLKQDFKVLDVGCGDGHTLKELADSFRYGIGIDQDASHIAMADEATKDIDNVSFRIAKAAELPFGDSEFDFVFSERGPMAGASIVIQSALKVLKVGGLIFVEIVGELFNRETHGVFGGDQLRKHQFMSGVEMHTVLFERNGVDIRIINNLISKHIFPDIYNWIEYQCGLWSYVGQPLPTIGEIDKIIDFYATNRNDAGELVTTDHKIWIGGVKQEAPPEYWEFRHFSE
jgi:ubiquinone/menaquinone biosynthesis C-methylase UbiE